MIFVDRGQKPAMLERIRRAEVARLARIVRSRRPRPKDFGKKYNVVQKILWQTQEYKCCYCERRLERYFNDVEHHRPKTLARRGPGHPDHGYWWLAWTWENLLFACPICNRKHKRNDFPLTPGSRILPARWGPPGPEMALLIDPSADEPLDHIQFVPVLKRTKRKWLPVPRAGSHRGAETIRVLMLDRPALLTAYEDHVADLVEALVREIQAAMSAQNAGSVRDVWRRAQQKLFRPRQQFKGLSYDVLDHHFPLAVRQRWGLRLRRP